MKIIVFIKTLTRKLTLESHTVTVHQYLMEEKTDNFFSITGFICIFFQQYIRYCDCVDSAGILMSSDVDR